MTLSNSPAPAKPPSPTQKHGIYSIFALTEQHNTIMRHIEKALIKLKEANPNSNLDYDQFISIDNALHTDNGEELFGVPPKITFTIQSDPISMVGINGIQAADMLEYTKCLFQSLNEAFPHEANQQTILKIQEAIMWQRERTRDRVNRGVEGHNLP